MSETNLNPVNAGQAAVVEQPTGAADAAVNTGSDQTGTPASGAATPSQTQSRDVNQSFAAMRKRAEQAERQLAQHQADAQRLSTLVANQYGYAGDPSSVADQMEAAATGRTVEEIRAEREAATAKDVEIQRLKDVVAKYEPVAIEHFKANLLARVKEVYPDVKATSVDEFGDNFAKLVADDVDPAVAYAAIYNTERAQEKPKPPEIGAVGRATPESDFYTVDEVRKMTKAEALANREKIIKSMPKW